MNIDFIKWMCEKAESYMVIENKIFYEGCYFDNIDHLWNNKLHKKCLLQEAIEGVSKVNPEWIQISQCGYSLQILTDCNRDVVKGFQVEDFKSIDSAKESALMYIYEQDKKNDKTLKLEGQKLALQETIKKDQRVTLTDIIERALAKEVKEANKR